MAASIEDLCNQALLEIGSTVRIQDIYEGSKASIAALEVYGQTRDEILDLHDWPFARRTAALALLKGPPPPGGFTPVTPWTTTYPKPGWLYEYTYPADCLDFGTVIPQPGLMFDLDPKPAVWRVDNDAAFNPPQRVILTNVPNALGVYTAQVIDPTTWEPGFVSVLVKALKTKLALVMGGNLDLERESLAETAVLTKQADVNRG
jgi:hypothetical protein